MRKLLATLLALAMVLALIPAVMAEGDALEPITLTCFIGDPGDQPAEDNKIYKLIEEKFGVTFEFEYLAGNLDETIGLKISNQDFADLFCAGNSADLAISERIVAIGEIGLDYHYSRDFIKAQHETFRTQLRWAKELDLPVIIHSRDATADCLDIVRSEIESHTTDNSQQPTPLRGVIHCYSGSQEVAQQWLAMGMYLGIGGVLTFKNSKLSETLAHIPLDRLLLETDGPYLAPTPHRGERNEPILMRFVVMRLAEIYNCTPEEVIQITSANSRSLFRLPTPDKK